MKNFYINQGQFTVSENRSEFRFIGGVDTPVNPITGQVEPRTAYGEVLFSDLFKEGKISFDIDFNNQISSETRVGVILNYRNTGGTLTVYQVGIRNLFFGYGIDYYNGQSWECKAIGGKPFALEAAKVCSLSVEVYGNNLMLSIDGVKVLNYSGFVNNFSGVCGIFVSHDCDLIIKNLQIDVKMPTVFNIMKFESDFDDLYNDVIKTQCERFGLRAIRADECYNASPILQDIIREISSASIIIADITMDNPNVFYELGYAHALQKPTILLADMDKRDKLPFDVSGYRTIFYANTIGGKKDVEQKLSKFIENIVSPNRNAE